MNAHENMDIFLRTPNQTKMLLKPEKCLMLNISG